MFSFPIKLAMVVVFTFSIYFAMRNIFTNISAATKPKPTAEKSN
jgi:hypothetical protein